MTFTENMDTTSLPPKPRFKINVNTVDKSITTLEWLNNRVLGAGFSEAALGPTTVRFEYTTQTGKLRTALGAEVEIFDLLGTEIFVSATVFYSDPNFLIAIFFNKPMDISVQPLPGDFIFTVDGVEKAIDSLVWSSPTLLRLEAFVSGLTPIIARFEFRVPVPDLRTTALLQACPFDLTTDIF